jgi:hypothetical protein
MRLWQIVALFVSLALYPPCPAPAQAVDAKPDLGANAAMKYWQAFGLLPAVDKDQEKLLQKWNEVPFDPAALYLIDRSRLSRLYLHRGAKLPRCDWSLDYEDGISMWLPHGPKSLTLARLTALHARHEFEQGHWKAGAADVTALLKLARHVEKDAINIIQLVGYRIEATAIEAAAPCLPELKPILPETVADVVDALPAGPTLSQMILKEKEVGPVWLIQALKKAEARKPGAWRAVLQEMLASPEDRTSVEAPQTIDEAVKMLEDVLSYYDELARMMARPWREWDAQYPELIKKARAANPLGVAVFPAFDKMVVAEHRNQAQMALFKAALAVVQGGPDKLRDIKDPFGDGPFEYRARDKGFELKSRLQFKGQPVTLTVGKAK